MIYAVFDKAAQEEFGFLDGVIPSLVSFIIVLLLLAALSFILDGVHKIKALDEKPKQIIPSKIRTQKRIKLEEIDDEDMMAAVLVAAIDYREEVKTDVELINVKEI